MNWSFSFSSPLQPLKVVQTGAKRHQFFYVLTKMLLRLILGYLQMEGACTDRHAYEINTTASLHYSALLPRYRSSIGLRRTKVNTSCCCTVRRRALPSKTYRGGLIDLHNGEKLVGFRMDRSAWSFSFCQPSPVSDSVPVTEWLREWAGNPL